MHHAPQATSSRDESRAITVSPASSPNVAPYSSQLTSRTTTNMMKKGTKRQSKWAYSNTFISKPMIWTTIQIMTVNVLLFASLVLLRPIVNEQDSFQDHHQQQYDHLDWKFSMFQKNSSHEFIEDAQDCYRHIRGVITITYFSWANILLCLPLTGIPFFALHKRRNCGKDIAGVYRTPVLTLCELTIVIEIPFLIAACFFAMKDAIETRFLADCASHMPIWLLLAFLLQTLLALYSYLLNWYQIVLFNRFRNHSLYQRGVFPADKNFKLRKTDFAWNARDIAANKLKLALLQAAKYNQAAEAQALIDQAATIYGEDFESKWYKVTSYFGGWYVRSAKNPLHVACAHGAGDVVEVLLKAGFSVNRYDRVQRAVIGLSESYKGLLTMCGLNVRSSTIQATASNLGERGLFSNTLLTPLHVAVAYRDIDTIEILLRHGAAVNKPARSLLPNECTTPLFWVKDEACLDLLIKAGANHLYVPSARFCVTPYQYLILQEEYEIAASMEKWGGDVALTPLHNAAGQGNLVAVEKILKVCSDPDALGEHCQGLFRRAPLHWAAMNGTTDCIEALLARGADIEARDTTGMTPLAWACVHNNISAVQTLLTAGADPLVLDSRNKNVVCVAASIDGIHEEIFSALVAHGGDINYKLPSGDTPLHIAIKEENKMTAISLLHAGANISILNLEGHRPIDCATSSELQYLIKKEAGSRDVMISYTHSHSEFAQKIRDNLEKNQITTWLDQMDPTGIGGGAVWREEIARGIHQASVVLSILSSNYPKSQWCMKELALAKQYDIPVMAITCEDVEMTDELQVYLYTRQLIDFKKTITNSSRPSTREVVFEYDNSSFEKQLLLLLDGIRDEIEKKRVQSEEQRIENMRQSTRIISVSSRNTLGPSRGFVFIAHAHGVSAFVNQLRQSLEEKGVRSTVGSRSNPDATKATAHNQSEILNCSAFIVILSKAASSNAILTDQLAFAEDRGKPIIPIVIAYPNLGQSQQYTLSRNRIFHFAEGIGYGASFSTLCSFLENLNPTLVDCTKPSTQCSPNLEVRESAYVDFIPATSFECHNVDNTHYAV